MDMIIFLKRFFTFLVFLSIFYTACVFLWGLSAPFGFKKNLTYKKGSDGHLYSRLEDLKAYGHVDVLFLGSSHAYRGFDPRIFEKYGIKSFNLGSSSQTPVQTEILLSRYLDLINPKLVIFEVFPGNLSNDGVESALDLIANDRLDFLSVKMALKLNHIKIYNTIIYRVIRDLFHLDRGFVEPVYKSRSKDTYIKGGFTEKELSYYDNNETHPIDEWRVDNRQKNAFERIIQKFNELKIKVVLVQAPIPREVYNSYLNNAEIDAYFKSISEYYNFNDILSLNSSVHFYDSHHLNLNGVKIFNTNLIDILTKEKSLCLPE